MAGGSPPVDEVDAGKKNWASCRGIQEKLEKVSS